MKFIGVCVAAFLLAPLSARAQELEPGAYWPLPNKMNILTAVNSTSWGDMNFDPSLPIDSASASINTTVGVFTRVLSMAGRTANVSAQFPIVSGHVEGNYLGAPAQADRFGQADPRLRVAINLYGAPSMDARAFSKYQLRTVVGTSLTVAPPLGQYDPVKLINIGANRWSFKSELGVSHALRGPWVVEGMFGVWWFTRNDEFGGTGTRTQDPILGTQVHLTYVFKGVRRKMWLAADANFYRGGQTTVNGTINADLQQNSRVGATYSVGLTRRQALRASFSRGAVTRIGGDFTTIAVGYSYAWLQ